MPRTENILSHATGPHSPLCWENQGHAVIRSLRPTGSWGQVYLPVRTGTFAHLEPEVRTITEPFIRQGARSININLSFLYNQYHFLITSYKPVWERLGKGSYWVLLMVSSRAFKFMATTDGSDDIVDGCLQHCRNMGMGRKSTHTLAIQALIRWNVRLTTQVVTSIEAKILDPMTAVALLRIREETVLEDDEDEGGTWKKMASRIERQVNEGLKSIESDEAGYRNSQ
ncbi:hypothetical protein BDZ97DRAFT_1763032 [Flammula alnicola]|nr:hypothetical protein BDZ97DRAFT_1763032 [Flammula alnicola]